MEPISLVTIGITSFNAEDTITAAVESALAQTWASIEILIVDDCSVDKTYSILADLNKKYKEIKIYKNNENMGVAYTRNKILNNANGEFVVFFDDDDASVPERVGLQINRIINYERMQDCQGLVICHSSRNIFYPNGEQIVARTNGEGVEIVAPHGKSVAENILLGSSHKDLQGGMPTCSQMARLSTYKLLDGFDNDFRRSEDTEFNVRLAKKGGHFVGIARPLVFQTMTKTSEKTLKEEQKYTLMLLQKHRDIPDMYGLYDFCYDWIVAKHLWLQKKKVMFVLEIMKIIIRYPAPSLRRLYVSIHNYRLNNNFSQFHTNSDN